MNEQERIVYATQMFAHEFDNMMKEVLFLTEERWDVHMMSVPQVDPTGAHKRFGLTAPQWVGGKFMMGVCVPRLIRPLADHDDDELQTWLEFWLLHCGIHIIMNKEAEERDESNVPLAEMERRVEERFKELAHGSYWFAEMVRGSVSP